MMDLSSASWKQWPSASGANGTYVRDLLVRLEQTPQEEDWEELFEQLGHQWTRAPVAYAALPHAYQLGLKQGKLRDPQFLFDLGRIACPIDSGMACPDECAADFFLAIEEAGKIALEVAASDAKYPPEEYAFLLQATAALSGRGELALRLLSLCMGQQLEVACPACQQQLAGQIQGDTLVLASEGDVSPGSTHETFVVPYSDRSETADLQWLLTLCESAQQSVVAGWVRLLYGTAECVSCHYRFTPIAAAINN